MSYPRSRAPAGGRGQAPQARSEPAVQYSFPHMTVSEILEDMVQGFGQPLTEGSLKSPTAEVVRGVFAFFLGEIYGEDMDEKLRTVPRCLNELQYADIHEESPGMFHFVRAVYEMLCTAQYHDFTLHDLITPTRPRFRWQISALLNLAKFQASRAAIYQAVAAGEDECVAQHGALQTSIENLDAEIADIESKRAEEEPAVEENKRIGPELKDKANELRTYQRELTAHTSEQKAVVATLSDKRADLKSRVRSIESDTIQKKSEIVASPDRARAEIAAMEDKQREFSVKTAECRRRKTENQARGKAIQEFNETWMQRLYDATEETKRRLHRKHEAEKKLAKSQAKKAEIEQGMRADAEKLNELMQSTSAMERRKARLEQTREQVNQQLDQDLQRKNQMDKEAKQHSIEVEQKIEAAKQREKELYTASSLKVKEFKDRMEDWAAVHTKLMEARDKNDDQLREMMRMFAADNKNSVESLKHNVLST